MQIDQQELARCLFDESNDAFFIFQPEDGSVVDANPAALRMTGLTHAEVVGMPLADLFTGEGDLADLLDAFQGTGHFRASDDYSIRRQTDTPLPVRVSASRIHTKPDPLGLAVVFDISHIKQAQEESQRRSRRLQDQIEERAAELEVRERQFRSLVENAPVCIHQIDADGKLLSMNHAGLAMLNLTDETEVRGMPYLDAVAPQDRPRLAELFDRALAGETSHFEFQTRNGLHFVSCFVPLPEHGGARRVMGVTQDVTERKRAESALRESEERYRRFVEQSREGIALIEFDQPIPTSLPEDEQVRRIHRGYRFVTCNDAFARMYGFEQAGDLIGKRQQDIDGRARNETSTNVNGLREAVRAGYRLSDLVTEEFDRYGNQIFISNSWTGVIEDGSLTQVWVIQQDITEHHKTQLALRERNKQFSTLAASIPAAVMIVRDETVVYSNRAAEVLLGFTCDELQDMPTGELVHPDDRAMVSQRSVQRQAGERVSPRYEFRVVTRAGDVRWVDFSGALIEFDGQPAILTTAVDITDRKLSEAAIRGLHMIASETDSTLDEKISQLLWLGCERLGAELGIVGVVDGELYRVEYVVAGAEFPIEQGSAVELADTICEHTLEAASPLAIDCIGETKWADTPFCQRTGIQAYFGTPVYVGGDPIGTVSFCSRRPRQRPSTDPQRDFIQLLARRVGAELERERSTDRVRGLEGELAHLARVSTMGEMATAVAHEVNQPLAAIANYAGGGAAGLSRGSLETAETVDLLRRIEQQTKRAGDIVNRLKRFVVKGMPVRSQLNVNSVVRETCEFMRLQVRRRRARIDLQLDDSVPPAFADSVQIQQVLTNAIQNGLDSMQDTDVEQRLLVISTTAVEGGVRISVADRGCGLTAEVASRLFEPFYTSKPDGLGMGLRICQRIIDAHNGELQVRGNADGGVTLQFTLPCTADGVDTTVLT